MTVIVIIAMFGVIYLGVKGLVLEEKVVALEDKIKVLEEICEVEQHDIMDRP